MPRVQERKRSDAVMVSQNLTQQNVLTGSDDSSLRSEFVFSNVTSTSFIVAK